MSAEHSNHTNSQHFSRLTPKKEQNLWMATRLLDNWLDDIVDKGFYHQQNALDQMESLAARLVDFGVPGIAKKIRMLQGKLHAKSDRVEHLSLVLGEFSLFCSMMKGIDQLNSIQREDLLSYAGIPYHKKNLSNERSVDDQWLYVGYAKEREEKLTVYRHWFVGNKTNVKILWIEYLFGQSNRPKRFVIGRFYSAVVRFFPSATPSRIDDIHSSPTIPKHQLEPQNSTLKEVVDHFSLLLTYNPFIRSYVYVLRQTEMQKFKGKWCLWDGGSELFPLDNQAKELDALTSVCKLDGTYLFVEFLGKAIKVLSILLDGQVLSMNQLTGNFSQEISPEDDKV